MELTLEVVRRVGDEVEVVDRITQEAAVRLTGSDVSGLREAPPGWIVEVLGVPSLGIRLVL